MAVKPVKLPQNIGTGRAYIMPSSRRPLVWLEPVRAALLIWAGWTLGGQGGNLDRKRLRRPFPLAAPTRCCEGTELRTFVASGKKARGFLFFFLWDKYAECFVIVVGAVVVGKNAGF